MKVNRSGHLGFWCVVAAILERDIESGKHKPTKGEFEDKWKRKKKPARIQAEEKEEK